MLTNIWCFHSECWCHQHHLSLFSGQFFYISTFTQSGMCLSLWPSFLLWPFFRALCLWFCPRVQGHHICFCKCLSVLQSPACALNDEFCWYLYNRIVFFALNGVHGFQREFSVHDEMWDPIFFHKEGLLICSMQHIFFHELGHSSDFLGSIQNTDGGSGLRSFTWTSSSHQISWSCYLIMLVHSAPISAFDLTISGQMVCLHMGSEVVS
jgi:hypothetical protein